MDELQGKLLSVKLNYLDKWTDKRINAAKTYNSILDELKIQRTATDSGRHVYHIYSVLVSNRNKVMEKMTAMNIGVGSHYPIPCHQQEGYKKYIKIGPTKIVDIDFSLSFPTSSYFVAVNMLLEFTPQGQVVPTRIDILPYKFGAFAKYNIDPTGTIDIFKFMLVIYTVTIVVQNFMALKTWRKMLTMSAMFDNFTDMMVIFL